MAAGVSPTPPPTSTRTTHLCGLGPTAETPGNAVSQYWGPVAAVPGAHHEHGK
ncbi:hypothetical protein HU200_059678 [Digitaria exilis]|uniref:Uncharacterized protein n=1 Tax=Digitaria exilis TaxID=1010633 RepID=A0A835DY26_9POAL|nr:hypothetical protein HU200_059678 [Digitaria exilis]